MDGNKGGLVGPPCSRNAHDEAVVVRRAQLGTNPGHPLKRKTSELGGNIDSEARATCSSEGARESRLEVLLCSCNARSQKTLVGHAQWETL